MGHHFEEEDIAQDRAYGLLMKVEEKFPSIGDKPFNIERKFIKVGRRPEVCAPKDYGSDQNNRHDQK